MRARPRICAGDLRRTSDEESRLRASEIVAADARTGPPGVSAVYAAAKAN